MAPKQEKATIVKKGTAKKDGAPKPPALPKAESNAELPVTDPRRTLSKEELKALTPEQRKARREARAANRAPAKTRVIRNIDKVAKRLDRFVKLLGDQGKDLAKAVLAVRQANDDLNDALAADWRPAGGGGGGAPARAFEVGQKVKLSDKARENYSAVLEPSEMDSLKIEKVVGKKVVVLAGKNKLFLPAAALRHV